MVSQARRQALQEAGQPVPEAQRILALIDTGAGISGIDPSVLSALRLPPTGEMDIHTPSTNGFAVKADTFDVVIGIYAGRAGDIQFLPETMQVTSTVLANQGIQALLGRDLLKSCMLHYNGADGFYSLAY
jgi:hypothetical protein